jgi:tRNA pseudouridine32 synthase / 23S rRNA pseudouridine746 synthase
MVPTRDGVSPSCVALPSGPWPLVLDFLAERLPALGRAQWHERMAGGEVLDASGHAVPPDEPYRPRAQTKLYYWRHWPGEQAIPVQERVRFRDELIVVADKPAFLPVVPSGRYVQETLLVRLRRQLGIDTLTPVHRIDMDTAGLVLFCIQPRWRDAYQSLFRSRRVHKAYEAIAPWRAELALPTVRRTRLQDSSHFMVMQEVPGEPNAETHVALLNHWVTPQGEHLGHYELTPVTGQRHQLRVHMNAMGMPILHDRIYPTLLPEPPVGSLPDLSRPLQLLARSLRFDDPVNGESRAFSSQLGLSELP